MESNTECAPASAQLKPCPNGTLVAMIGEAKKYCPSLCRRWQCERCGRRNSRRLAARIMLTPVRRFATLTIRADTDADPMEQLDQVNRAFRLLWKRIKRRHGRNARGYVKVVEFTARGTPHLHVALDTPFLAQSWLSEQWHELTGSPIVDIRAVHTHRGLARYLAKYLTKAIQTVAHRRKYSAARGWLPAHPTPALAPGELPPAWRWTAATVEALSMAAQAQGYELLDGWWHRSHT